jgi:hypothetical protein
MNGSTLTAVRNAVRVLGTYRAGENERELVVVEVPDEPLRLAVIDVRRPGQPEGEDLDARLVEDFLETHEEVRALDEDYLAQAEFSSSPQVRL